MGKSKTTGKGRLDKFYYLAKEQGYRSRAAFKLVHLNRKYNFLEKTKSLLDLCAAPGGWLQVAAKYMPISSLIVGVDLVPIRPIRNVKTLMEDITTPKCRSEIKKILGDGLLDVVLHDGSPNVGGVWSKEAMTQTTLSLDALKLATEFLKPGGMFISKVFRSKDYTSLLFVLHQLFARVEATKPISSRSTSAEIYVVCQGFKAPAKIDPRLLDAKHVFKEVDEGRPGTGGSGLSNKAAAVLFDDPSSSSLRRSSASSSLPRASREGYEEGLSLVHKETNATEFLFDCPSAVDCLAQHHRILFREREERDKAVKEHAETTGEILALCDDLQLLGRKEFKQLLKWRLRMRKFFPQFLPDDQEEKGAAEKREGEAERAGEGERKEGDVDEEENLLVDEMEQRKGIVEAERRREKKRQRKRKEKLRLKSATGMKVDALADEGVEFSENHSTGGMDVGEGDGLFSIKSIHSKSQLSILHEGHAQDSEGESDGESEGGEGEGESEEVEEEESDIDAQGDQEKQRYFSQLEVELDEAFSRYCDEREGKSRRRKRAKLEGEREREEAEGQGKGAGAGARADEVTLEEGARGNGGEGEREMMESGTKEGDDELVEDERGGGLLLPLTNEKMTRGFLKNKVENEFFAQDLFEGEEVFEGGSKSQKPIETRKKTGRSARMGESDEAEGEGFDVVPLKWKMGLKREEEVLSEGESEEEGEREEGRELVGKREKGTEREEEELSSHPSPTPPSFPPSSPTSSPSSSDYDTDEKSEILAMAKKMLGKRVKDDIIDDGYHRFMFDDDARALPRWFSEDERKFMRRANAACVTKEEVEAMRAQFREINARPVKKVAEAKARKRRRLQKKQESVRRAATTISEQTDLNARSKSSMIERLYKGAQAKEKREMAGGGKGGRKEVVVSKKGASRSSMGRHAGKGKVMVDKRLKKDARATKARDKRERKKGGGEKKRRK